MKIDKENNGLEKCTKRTPVRARMRERFLKALSDGATVGDACRSAGIARRTAYTWRDRDKEFREAWDSAILDGVDALEGEALRRAVRGVIEPVVSAGKLVTKVRKYSDTLLIFLLKARDPRFRDKSAVELTGKDGEPLKVEAEDVKQKLLAKLSARRVAVAAAQAKTLLPVSA